MDAKWREQIPEGEAERFEALAKRLVGDAKRDARTLHARAHLALHARFEVGDVEEDLRHGVFAAPAVREAYVRFSSGAGHAQPDRAPDVRAVAVKVVGVEGDKIIPTLEKAKTQDFLAILTPTFGFRTPDAFVDVASSAARGQLAVVGALIRNYGLFGMLSMLPKLQGALDKSPRSLAERTYYTALPIRLGPHAVKLRFRAESRATTDAPRGDDTLGAELCARLAKDEVRFAVEVQRFVDEERTPIEDPTVAWDESVAPWSRVAALVLPRQDARGAAGQKLASYVESLSFDPWHALPEHRPLGAIMRARAVAYRHSVEARGARSELEVVPPSELLG